MLKISTLFSSSRGNCTLVRSQSTAILIDCGWNCKAICERLQSEGLELSDISAIFITHEHTDHISALDVLMRKKPIPIHCTSPSAVCICRKKSAGENTVIHRGLVYSEKVGDLNISSFPLPHDSAAHVGYRITSDDGDAVGVATDIGYITEELSCNLCGCRQVVIESNHDTAMLRNGPYPYELKRRILGRGGHLSNEECGKFCKYLAENGTEAFLLAHLSEENNTPEKALAAVGEYLSEGVTLRAAARYTPTNI